MPVAPGEETPASTLSPLHPPLPVTPEPPKLAAAESPGGKRGEGDEHRPAEEMNGSGGGGADGRAGGGTAGGAAAKGVAEAVSGVFVVSGTGGGKGPLGFGYGTGNGAGVGSGYGEETGKGMGFGRGAGSGGGIGDGAEHGGGTGTGFAEVLGAIRRQIERAKVYPETARRRHQEGTVELRFRIAVDGLVEAVEIVRSSGHEILDESATQTIRRAVPYPKFAGWIRVPLAYRLEW
jgi:TonB family protein